MYDVFARIREMCESTDEADPVRFAELLVASMTQRERAAAFTQVAATVVNIVLTRERSRLAKLREPAPQPVAAGRVVTLADEMREGWRNARLRARMRGAESWKMLADFTVADFIHAARERRARAAANVRAAEWMDSCRVELELAGVSRFAELPDDRLEVLLKESAE